MAIKIPPRPSLLSQVMITQDCSEEEAREQIAECRAELNERLADGDMPFDILEEWFGLEPDWLDELI